MKLSAKAEYACLAMLALARHEGDGAPMRVREIAKAQNLPEPYLIQILLQLKGAGLVFSTRGSGGGYRLARSASEISLKDVIGAIDGPAEPPRDEAARGPGARGLLDVLDTIRNAQESILMRTTIAELARSDAGDDWVI